MSFDFEPFRREIGGMPDAIDLISVYRTMVQLELAAGRPISNDRHDAAVRMLEDLTSLQPIRSRQAAATALAVARALARREA